MIRAFVLSVLLLHAVLLSAQNFPAEWRVSGDNHIIKQGGLTESGLYKHDEIKTFNLTFSQSNWWSLLTQNYNSGAMLSATLEVDGVTYEQVGVGFKGQTSYMMVNGQKKSFSIKTDEFIAGQDIDGYNNFNLNNCFDDPSFMREFLYLRQIRNHIPASRAAYVHLNINGESWGLYPSVQQLNKDFYKEWFLSNDGTNWRADKPDGTMGGGPQWGDGTAALNWLGGSESEYQQYYTLKSTTVDDPWANLIQTCDVLNNTVLSQLPNVLPDVLDVDRTLWFLASEIAWGDDDSYVFKGKMDYYCYWEIETGRLVPQEYDGNSVLVNESDNWGPFYHVNNANYPLLNKLLNVPQYRQRYLAHLRTIIAEEMNQSAIEALVSEYDALINAEVQADPKKLYSYNQYTSGLNTIKNKIQNRVTVLNNNSELNTTGATITNVVAIGQNGSWLATANEEMLVNATVYSADPIQTVRLYYSDQLVGNFQFVVMHDDGNSGDGAAGDGVYGGMLPGVPMSSIMRFYIEAEEGNTAKTLSYSPAGAEHDVYFYQALPQWAPAPAVVINEAMAINHTTAADEQGQYEDWIELYNTGSQTVDLSGYFITDNSQILDKWDIPQGTLLAPDSYLIIWADEDSSQGPLHANFKLSGTGEQLTLINAQGLIADQVLFGQQQADKGYARVPNGTGAFVIQPPTFAANNNTAVSVNDAAMQEAQISLFPNPASQMLHLRTYFNESTQLNWTINDTQGRTVMSRSESFASGPDVTHIDISTLPQGTYFFRFSNSPLVKPARFVVVR